MKPGDLVKKRWGRLEVFHQKSVGLCVERFWRQHSDFITVAFPSQPLRVYRRNDFEVVSES